MKGRVCVIDSDGGVIRQMTSLALLAAPAHQDEYNQILKAVGDPKPVGSRRLREKYGVTLNGAACAARPFDMAIYAYAATLNTYHSRAIRAKVKDIVGRKWSITGDGGETQRQAVTSFFTNAFGEQTFDEGMGNVWTDYESLGNGFLEVIPDSQGRAAAMAHVPATETWVRLDEMGFVQVKNGEYSHFRRWGLDRDKLASLKPSDPLRAEGVTEVIHFSRYFPWSPYYGLPSIMPAWNRVALSTLEAEYNLAYFQHNAIPDYAVLLEGEWEPDSDKLISDYFKAHVKGKSHKTLVLEVPEGRKVTFEKLTSDNAKEGAFRLLRVDCRDEILHAHGVPPQKVGIVETGRLGGNAASEQIVEYRTSIVEPGQNKVCTRLNRLIEQTFGAGWSFAFEPYMTEDLVANSGVDAVYLDHEVVTPGEVRKKRFPDLPERADLDEPLHKEPAAVPVEEIAKLQKAVRGAMRKSRQVQPT
jgi:hypothetical protein